jgi:hypothetical protein
MWRWLAGLRRRAWKSSLKLVTDKEPHNYFLVTELQRLAEVKWARLEKEEVVQGNKAMDEGR